jgi:hypothetical protein
LFDYARTHPVLEETAPLDTKVVLHFLALTVALPVGLVLGSGVLFGWLISALVVGLLIGACLATGLGLFALPLALLSVYWGGRGRPTVKVQDGVVRVTRPGMLPRGFERSVYLSECRWAVTWPGLDFHTSQLYVFTARGRIGLQLAHWPGAGWTWRNRTQQWGFCGWTPEMKNAWGGFLTLARVPEAWGPRKRTTGQDQPAVDEPPSPP